MSVWRDTNTQSRANIFKQWTTTPQRDNEAHQHAISHNYHFEQMKPDIKIYYDIPLV